MNADRYEIFAREYVIDMNGTRAALAAGYSEKTAHVQASQLLRKLKVRSLIDKQLQRRASKLELRADKITEELSRMAFSNILDYVQIEEGEARIDLSNVTRDQAAAIQEVRSDTTGGIGDGERKLVVRTTLKLADKTKNLELLGRHLGMFQDKMQVTGLDNLAQALANLRQGKQNASTGA